MFANISGWHLILLLVVVLLLFGAARLPALAKGVGQSVRILKTETKDLSAGSPATAERAPREGDSGG
jgi:sec-independent protein translocase protein TatA